MNTAGKRRCNGAVRNVLCAALCVALYVTVPTTYAQSATSSESIRQYDIPAGSLSSALSAWGAQSGKQVVFAPALIADKRTQGITGQYSAEQALTQLLAGTGLAWKRVNGQTYALEQAPPPANADQKADVETRGTVVHGSSKVTQLGAVTVTGTRITGAPSASPTIRLSQRQIRAAGQHDLGEVIRDLPENFSGGQNPGVAQGAGSNIANQNVNSGAAVNLRGLGPDATLTLLNGRRLSYDGFVQGVDISAIPLAAVDRIEVVPDGASAIYGSDAVASVVNVILQKDFQGVTTAARLGTATEGGGFQQEYSVTGGTRWSSGGFLASFDYERQEPIRSDQRDYTRYMPKPADLLPYQRHQNAIFTLHQDIGDIGTFSIDTLYNKRWTSYRFSPSSPAFRNSHNVATETYAISPTAEFYLPNTWTVKLNGLFGADRTHYSQQSISTMTGAVSFNYAVCYCNKEKSVELGGEGPLFPLPGGDAKLAVGVGYRDNGFRSSSVSGTSKLIGSRSSRYAFGELFLPLIGPNNDVPLVHSLSFSGAARYENYSDLGSITTPKLGIIYAPTADVDFKGSWGRSFKAPTLLQGNEELILYLFPAAVIGGTGYPADATVLMPYGGNHDLRPERAETWSVTASLHPRAIEGFHIDLTYFSVAYRDRVIQPLTITAALSNPVYREFLTYDPSAAEQAALIAMALDGLTPYPGVTYDPDNVVAIANDVYTNIARQHIHGVDLKSDYRFDVAGGNIDLSGNASWLTSRQQNSPGAPVFPLAGTIFNPPHFHARAGVIWTKGGLTASTFLNWLGPVQDIQSSPPVDGGSMTTLDLALLYHVGAGPALLRNTEFSLSIQNLTDRHPPYLQPRLPYFVNYDSTNYSAIGRFISLGISKHF